MADWILVIYQTNRPPVPAHCPRLWVCMTCNSNRWMSWSQQIHHPRDCVCVCVWHICIIHIIYIYTAKAARCLFRCVILELVFGLAALSVSPIKLVYCIEPLVHMHLSSGATWVIKKPVIVYIHNTAFWMLTQSCAYQLGDCFMWHVKVCIVPHALTRVLWYTRR